MIKSEIRALSLQKRQAITPEDRALWSHGCGGNLLKCLDGFPEKAETVAGYMALRDEMDITTLFPALTERYLLTLPVILPGSRILSFKRFMPGDSLVAGMYETQSPLPQSPETLPDIVLVPLLAFDRKGHRIGYGGGYYDATLAHLSSIKPVIAIGIAFSLQEADAIPVNATDQQLNAIITEREVVIPR